MINIFWLVPIVAIISLIFARYFFKQMKKEHPGSERMVEIASKVAEGAMAYLKQQYKVIAVVFLTISALLACMSFGLKLQSKWVPFAFLTAGFFSGFAGFCGMRTACTLVRPPPALPLRAPESPWAWADGREPLTACG